MRPLLHARLLDTLGVLSVCLRCEVRTSDRQHRALVTKHQLTEGLSVSLSCLGDQFSIRGGHITL
ncbi:MAG: hypothetical protein FJ290_05730 [Planctomycetes bacterium]|nr:hypothetical protein [Planctomycetota bacterium]